MRRRAALAVALLISAAGPGAAQSPAVEITGQVQSPMSYTQAALADAPSVEVQGAREGGVHAQFAGPLLWPLIAAAKPVDAAIKGAKLQHVLIARGADGYAVALAIGEVDPNSEGKSVIVALTQDGAKLATPRLVVPGDKHASRNVRDLVSIEIR